MDKEIMKRCDEYIKDLHHDERDDTDQGDKMQEPSILISEVDETIENMKDGKAPGSDHVAKEEMKTLGNLGLEIMRNC